MPRALSAAAWWAYRQNLRLNFEWVWDGRHIYLVQADEAKTIAGVDPTCDPIFRAPSGDPRRLRCLVPISEEHAIKYSKIRNVQTYRALGLPIADMFVLDDPVILDAILKDNPPPDLLDDLSSLVQNSLVIRTDLVTDDTDRRQLLPRTNEVRALDPALRFLRETLNVLRSQGISEQIAFIFHNFIAAVASAFVYAAPGQRKVRIEALWGLPEGLYYNAHDKLEVDTLSKDIKAVRLDQPFKITKRPHFKRYFFSPDAHGNWIAKQIAQPWDWRLCIRKKAWIHGLAFHSRRIAEKEGRSVSVMWFVEVPRTISPQPVFPWHHEGFDFERLRPASVSRGKTPFDRSCIIRTQADIDALDREASREATRIREIRIQPREEALLRDKNALKLIGQLARKINAVVFLEGGTLSHAYYQLIQTKALVEVAYPFDVAEDKQEFNKLVRDRIPARIRDSGERVRIRQLRGDSLLRALREKLVEETFEALDARDRDAILDELADVEEVIDAILRQLRARRSQLKSRQQAKRERAGGFEHGYILVDTSNPPPVEEDELVASTLPLLMEIVDEDPPPMRPHRLTEHATAPILARWADRRDHSSASEHLLNLVVSLIRESWAVDSREIPLGDRGQEILRARIKGKRVRATLNLDLSVFVLPRQLNLLD